MAQSERWMVMGLYLVSLLLTVQGEDCPVGFFGPRCMRRCKEQSHCLHNDCVLLGSGRALNCSQGCRPGWRGLSCNSNCKHPCKKCNRYSGECEGPCRDGFYGHTCSKYCPQRCTSCRQDNGTCLRCSAGYYGENCSKDCPGECVECDGSGRCPDNSNAIAFRAHQVADENPIYKEDSHNKLVSLDRVDDKSTVSREDSTTDFFSTSRPSTRRRFPSTTPDNSVNISSLVIIFVFITISVITVALIIMLLCCKRRGRRLKKSERERECSSRSGSPFLDKEYLYPVPEQTYPEGLWPRSAGYMNPSADSKYMWDDNMYSSEEPLYHEIGKCNGDADTASYITAVNAYNTVK